MVLYLTQPQVIKKVERMSRVHSQPLVHCNTAAIENKV